MIPVSEATDIVLRHLRSWGDEEVPISEAVGRVLAEPIHADRDFPPFNRVSMDGIAIQYARFAAGQRQFPVAGTQMAGSPQMQLDDPKHCLEVMTGSVLPQQTDTVIRYEDVSIENGIATITIEDIRAAQNAHQQGLDRKAGSEIVPAGCLLSAAEVGVAATVGKTQLKVKVNPRIVLISTGDELVEIEQKPLPHQIRKSNVYALQAALRQQGIVADLLHLPDEKEAIRKELEQALGSYHALVLSGGVSKGKRDYIPEVMDALEVEKLFHRVQQRPGKPFWFGHRKGANTVFALPGNPVSSFMCLHRYVLPWWRASQGLPSEAQGYATLTEDYSFKPNLTYFLQVKLRIDEGGQWLAQPITGKGSGDLANLVDADGFLELPTGQTDFAKGTTFPLWTYR